MSLKMMLETCPCCAGTAKIEAAFAGSLYEGFEVECTNAKCGCRSGVFPTKPMASRAWNTRADAPATGDATKRAVAIVGQARTVYKEHVGDGAWIAMERSLVDLIASVLVPPPAPGDVRELKTWKNGRLGPCTLPEFIAGLRSHATWADQKFSNRSDGASHLGERLNAAADALEAPLLVPECTCDYVERRFCPVHGERASPSAPDGQSLAQLQAAAFDPTNHHNALKCPYCNPRGLAFAAPDGAATQVVLPRKLTGEIACILEDCSPPDAQTADAVTALIKNYEPMWEKLLAICGHQGGLNHDQERN